MPIQNAVTLHPYFRPHAGKFDEFLENLSHFVEKTKSEEGCLFYGFTKTEDIIFCREGYRDAEATLHHLENVGEALGEVLKIAEFERLEIHGPASELAKLRDPLSHLPIDWFILCPDEV